MYTVKTPKILSLLTKNNLVWEMSGKEKRIFLTFDDGPIPELTPWILETLNNYNAKATFFCVGENLKKHQDIYQQIKENAHVIGNHTENHLNGWKNKPQEYIDNIQACEEESQSKLFRPPYGKIKPKQIKMIREEYAIIYWTVLSGDFDESLSPQKCLQRILKKTKAGSIVVFHDNIKAIPRITYALPRFLAHFSALGYRFEALCEKEVKAIT